MAEQHVKSEYLGRPQGIGAPSLGARRGPVSARGPRVLTFVGVLALGVLVTAGYLWSLPRVYQSTATLLVRADPVRGEEPAAVGVITTAPAQTLLSRPLLVKVLERLPAELTRGRIQADHAPDRVAALRTMLSVVEAVDANMLELSARGSDRELLREVVAQWVAAFLEHDAESRSKDQDTTAIDLAAERDVLDRRIAEQRGQLDEFRRQHDIQSMEREDNVVASRLRGLNESLNKAEDRLAEAEGRLESLHQAIEAGQPIGTQQEWRAVVQLERRLVELKEAVKELEAKYTERYIAINPEMRAVFDQHDVVERELAAKLESVKQGALYAAEQEVTSAAQTVRTVQRELDEHKQRSAEFAARFSEFEALESGLAELELRAQEVSARLLEEEVSRTSDRPSAEVLEPASLPSFPVSPDYPLIAGSGVGVSLILALLAVWLRDYLSRPDAAEQVPANVYYSVVDARPLNGERPAALDSSPDPKVAEASPAPMLGKVPRELSFEEVGRLLGAADDSTRLLAGLLLSGASAKEAAALRWRDLSLDAMSVSVGGAEPRAIAIPPGLRPVLESLAGDATDDALLWHDAAAEAMAVEELDAMLEYAAHEAELPRPAEISTSALRHTHIVYLAGQGVDLSGLEKLIGYLAPSEKVRYRTLAGSAPGRDVDPRALVHPALRGDAAT